MRMGGHPQPVCVVEVHPGAAVTMKTDVKVVAMLERQLALSEQQVELLQEILNELREDKVIRVKPWFL